MTGSTPSLPSASVQLSIVEHIEGCCSFAELGLDLSIHANDSLERKNAHEQFNLSPKLTVALILEGDLDAALDDHPLCVTSRNGPAGYLWINRNNARLDRWTRSGQRIRKIIVSLPLEQFARIADPGDAALAALTTGDMVLMRWAPNPQSLRYAEEIFAAERDISALNALTGAMAALGLIRQALMQNQATQPRTPVGELTTRDAQRARTVRNHLLDHIDAPLPLDDLAKAAGMSVRNLQRVFKNAYGATVMEFVRTRRLELARLALLEDGINVSEAAYRAGYSGVANFSTAFQREFGYPPSVCIRAPGRAVRPS
ncbi:MAG: helix-turn-helix transcriptional regulator [Rhodocyclaceae bacterium]|nr:helix-turn-helix transcriptional regulator [Rhodocyclaceae bacterium]